MVVNNRYKKIQILLLIFILLIGSTNIVYASNPNSNEEYITQSNLENDKKDIAIKKPTEEYGKINREDWNITKPPSGKQSINSSEILETIKLAFIKLIEGFKIFLNFLLEKDVFRKLADFFANIARALLELIDSIIG